MKKEINIPSFPKSIIEVENYVNDLQNEYLISDEVFGNILISLTEAVNNAIIYGNKNDSNKFVSISHKINDNTSPKTLIVLVKDEGNGFDYNNLPDPTAPENLTMIGGRGIFLIKQLADCVIFSDKGNSIELQFKI